MMNNRWKEFIFVTLLLYFVSEVGSIILYEICKDFQASLIALLNAGITLVDIYLYKDIKEDFQKLQKFRIWNFAIFILSFIVTGYAFDLIKAVQEEIKDLPKIIYVSLYILVFSIMLPVLWMFYILLIDQGADNRKDDDGQ